MHEIHFGLIKEEMVVQRGYTQTAIERSRQDGIYFIVNKNGVAPHHGFCVRALESGPRPQSHERRHLPSRDRYLHVIARKGNFVDSFRSVELALQPRDFIDLCRIERGECTDASSDKDRDRDQIFLHWRWVGSGALGRSRTPCSQLMLLVLFLLALFLALFVLA